MSEQATSEITRTHVTQQDIHKAEAVAGDAYQVDLMNVAQT